MGLDEPHGAILPDGRILVLLRAGARLPGDGIPGVTSGKRYSISRDNGASWSRPEFLRYDDGGTRGHDDSGTASESRYKLADLGKGDDGQGFRKHGEPDRYRKRDRKRDRKRYGERYRGEHFGRKKRIHDSA